MMAALNEVPDPTKFAEPILAEGWLVSVVEPGAARLTTDRPEVTRSGLTQPSAEVGPTALKSFISSSVMDAVAMSSKAPTEITSGSSPGERMLPLNGPEFPAATTTAIPACQTASTA